MATLQLSISMDRDLHRRILEFLKAAGVIRIRSKSRLIGAAVEEGLRTIEAQIREAEEKEKNRALMARVFK